MTTDGGTTAGNIWTDDEWLTALNILAGHAELREARMTAYADILAHVRGLSTQVAALAAERQPLREVAEAARKLVALCIAIEAKQPLTGMVTSEELAAAVKQEDAETAMLFAADTRLRNAVAALDATTPPAGAQEAAPETMEQCEWCGQQYPSREMNDLPWPDDEHTRRICDRCIDDSY